MYDAGQLPMISLFTGAGGLDLGLEEAGFTTTVAVEIDKWARATLDANRPKFRNRDLAILDDVTAYTPIAILEAAKLQPNEAFLLVGGPPCQSFSTAGRRGSLGDPRGGLFKNYADVVEAAQPRFFVFENVRGLLSAAIKHRPLDRRGYDHPPLEAEEEQGSAFQIILDELELRLGYQLVHGMVDAADYGVPQNRKRVLILGSRDGEFTTRDLAHVIPPTHKDRWVTLGQALHGLNGGAPEFLEYSADRKAVLAEVPAGKNWRYFRDHPDHGPERAAELMGGAWGADGGRVGFFRRLTWDKPSPTLPTSPIQKSTCLCHPVETRPLSVQEYARIQQFPPDYVFQGGTGQKYKQIGNAVPVGLGKAIGQAILNIADGCVREGQVRLLDGEPESAYA